MDSFQLYKDMQTRTNGEIYIGVVGPVRTGKSTFIKRFMDLLVLPNIIDEHDRKRTQDELPQSASGTMIMTTEPKFIPKDAAQLKLGEDVNIKVRLIDCVGFMVDGAIGHIEHDVERQVKTPWFDTEIPFTKAAAIGTQKVIRDHSTIGLVVTTDGSIGEIPRQNYVAAEEQTIQELRSIGKPFLIILNCKKPYSEEAQDLKQELEKKYKTTVITVNCEQLKMEDINQMIQQLLYEFPISEVEFFIPKWVEMLSREHVIKQDLLKVVKKILDELVDIRSAGLIDEKTDSPYIEKVRVDRIEMDTGKVCVQLEFDMQYYYQVLSELTGTSIQGEYKLISVLKSLSAMKEEYVQIKDAFADVKRKGYGVVSPKRDEIVLDEPTIIKQGNKFGVKIHSEAPSIHMIRANIATEIAPIVGSEKQAEDLVQYIKAESQNEEGVWATNIFGKSVEELVIDGIQSKLVKINEESQVKLQDTMQKIVNDSNGGLVCIII